MSLDTNSIAFFRVGGSVRDEFLGRKTKDHDFTVVINGTEDIDDAWEQLLSHLAINKFDVFISNQEYLTVRARFPKAHTNAHLTADFVLARQEGPYTDGRRPDWVKPGTLDQDLSRRDFTINSLALSEDGTLIDSYNGLRDINNRLIRCVGKAEDRIREDALRALRAIRFSIALGFWIDSDLDNVLHSNWLPPLLSSISEERKREELLKACSHDTLATLELLMDLPEQFREACFSGKLWLKPTMED